MVTILVLSFLHQKLSRATNNDENDDKPSFRNEKLIYLLFSVTKCSAIYG